MTASEIDKAERELTKLLGWVEDPHPGQIEEAKKLLASLVAAARKTVKG